MCKLLKLEAHYVPVSTFTVALSYHLLCFSLNVTNYILYVKKKGNLYRLLMWVILFIESESSFLKKRSRYASLRHYEVNHNFHKGVQIQMYFQLYYQSSSGIFYRRPLTKIPKLKTDYPGHNEHHQHQFRSFSFK